MPVSWSGCQAGPGCSYPECLPTTFACTKNCLPPSFEECLLTAWRDHTSRGSYLQLERGRERKRKRERERDGGRREQYQTKFNFHGCENPKWALTIFEPHRYSRRERQQRRE